MGHIESTGTSMISSSPSVPSLLPPPSKSSRSSTGTFGSGGKPWVPVSGPSAIHSSSAFLAASELCRPLRQLPLKARFLQKPAAYHLQMPCSTPAAPSPTLSKDLPPLPLPLPLPNLPLPPPCDSQMAACNSSFAFATWSSEPWIQHFRVLAGISSSLSRDICMRVPDSEESSRMRSPPAPMTQPMASTGTSTTSSTRLEEPLVPLDTASPAAFRASTSAVSRAWRSVSPQSSASSAAAASSLASRSANSFSAVPSTSTSMGIDTSSPSWVPSPSCSQPWIFDSSPLSNSSSSSS
mmetsp:Transcript_18659/g.65179  ORF Transcript_18659/g.65179 Transcript_18659/m.65179 type:complete len:295 (+) Transcript_18659:671-1555(+)